MAETESKEASLEKREAQLPAGVERIRDAREFVPPADIFETEDGVVILADMPGVSADRLDITLERNQLTLRGAVREDEPEGHHLAYAEYEVGDFVRSFSLSSEVDRDGIEASLKDGILTVRLPRVGPDLRQIEVKAE